MLAGMAAFAAAAVATAAPALTAARIEPPRGWPQTVTLGMRDPEHGAAALRRKVPLGVRYHYLSGGANTGRGWQTFTGGGGAFVPGYADDSRRYGFLTVFSYYMLLQSTPGSGESDERLRTTVNLGSRATMTAWLSDLRTFFQRAGASGVDPIVLHVEPDMWGYAQRSASFDDARTVPAEVASTGLPELAGLPNDVSGVARAIVRLRDRYARNVELGYHVSIWGTGEDISFSDPPDDRVDALAARTAAFYHSLGARFDLLFFEFADRDAGYREHVDGAARTGWWDRADFRRNQRYVGRVTSELRRPGVLWQIPQGNTRMRAMDNTSGHYQDNRVQTLLDPSRAELRRYRDAGIVALLFGPALPGATCACDAAHDGVTNPAPIDGNTAPSLSDDDDGGLFAQLARRYADDGPLPAASSARPPTLTVRASAKPRRARRGRLVRASGVVTSTSARRASVAVEIRGPGPRGGLRARRAWSARLRAGTPRTFALTWRVPNEARAGDYEVVVRVAGRRAAGSFAVGR